MKQKYLMPLKEEIDILSEQLDKTEFEILMYLKGFNRKILREMNEKGLMDFSIKYRY